MSNLYLKSFERIAKVLHRQFLVAVIACYLVAILLPGPGAELAGSTIDVGPAVVGFQSLLLSLALFAAAVGLTTRGKSSETDRASDSPHPASKHKRLSTPEETRSGSMFQRTAVALMGLTFVRIILLFVAASSIVLTGGHVIAVGLFIIAGMPSAMSSVPWTNKANGNVALSMSLIVGSLFVAPILMAAGLLFVNAFDNSILFGLSVESTDRSLFATPIVQLALFVPPVLLGLAIGRALDKRATRFVTPLLKMIPATVILLLNYCNAARVLPNLAKEGQADLLATAALATLVAVSTAILLAELMAARLQVARRDQVAITYSTSMFNTGMALVLVSSWLPDAPALLLPILLFTLGQHIVAAIWEKRKASIADNRVTALTRAM